jgi:fructose-1,6-bisphosphatase/inositol monophosphatase family enzyme
VDITVHFAARAVEAVRSVAVEEILPRYRSVDSLHSAGASQPRTKDDGTLVTEADFAAQRALIRALGALDDVPVLAEEMTAGAQAAIWEQEHRFWCVDPLDGTRNFSEAVPYFAVSVALMVARRAVFGVVYDPIADEAFYAARGAGAWLNAAPLVLPAQGPAIAGATAEVSLRREHAHLRSELKNHQPYARRVTRGSSALSWCHLAAARVDLSVDAGQMAWDFAAGALVLEEAGGRSATFESDDFWAPTNLRRSVIAARTPELFEAWRAWLRARL